MTFWCHFYITYPTHTHQIKIPNFSPLPPGISTNYLKIFHTPLAPLILPKTILSYIQSDAHGETQRCQKMTHATPLGPYSKTHPKLCTE